MQSEPYNTFSQATPETIILEDFDTPQHGFLSDQLHPGDHHGPNEVEYVQSTIFDNDARPDPSPEGDSRPRGQESRFIEYNRNDSPKASVQRISDYESALVRTPQKLQNAGPEFKIIKSKGNGLDGPQLDSFPNEVLTHILSHLPAPSLSMVSLVSRRFYSLVTTPHAWRIAFSRLFPCQDSIGDLTQPPFNSTEEHGEQLRPEPRLFTRLTALASWRSEYILRTRLLRSLGRGKPVQATHSHGTSSRMNNAISNGNAVVTYSSQLFATVNHIHATFKGGKKPPRFMHGADETGSASSSDPNSGKVDHWGLSDPQALPQFSDLFAGDLLYGEGDGPAGLPNCMDLSQSFGMIYGEGFPGGQAYFRSSEEQRGRFLSQPTDLRDLQIGAPKVPALTEAISAVWIAKSDSILAMTGGLIGMITGSTLGVVTAYSLGANTTREWRVSKGQLSSKWVVSPGVPIINLQVDNSFNPQRQAARRIWAVALNALGEIFYLTETPSLPVTSGTSDDESLMRTAWVTGRSACWNLIESSRRVARDDPYHEAQIHGSYSPRSSSTSMGLSSTQVAAETAEIETFLKHRPSYFRQACDGWDMRRRLEVDFGGDNGNGAGEVIVVISCGVVEGQPAVIKRFTRDKFDQAPYRDPFWLQTPSTTPKFPSAVQPSTSMDEGAGRLGSHGMAPTESLEEASKSIENTPISLSHSASPDLTASMHRGASAKTLTAVEEWRLSYLCFKDQSSVEITSSAIDMSTHALTILSEDPLQTANGDAYPSSPFATPSNQYSGHLSIPGHRARIIAIGTNNGVVVLWNMRGPQSANFTIANELRPMRTIVTDSPKISCLAISALYLVVGGNDGLVQAWDPLASSIQPIRTLNSRFSSRARRRLIQAEASIQGVGINLYAAGAIILDPDPKVLRGLVSLGTHLRYWSYSSTAADHYQSRKRRFRRSAERGSNGTSERFTNTGRGALIDYIATEQEELKNDRLRRSKEDARLRGRFGVGFGGLSEEEALTYAEMMSAETFEKDAIHRVTETADQSTNTREVSDTMQNGETSSRTITAGDTAKGRAISPRYKTDDELENDIEEAIRLSLLQSPDEVRWPPQSSASARYEVPITLKKSRGRRTTSSSSASTSPSSTDGVRFRGSRSKRSVALDDLDFALQLSLAEEHSRRGNSVEQVEEHGEPFPILESPELSTKGKGRAK